jgi:hypothetical protein
VVKLWRITTLSSEYLSPITKQRMRRISKGKVIANSKDRVVPFEGWQANDILRKVIRNGYKAALYELRVENFMLYRIDPSGYTVPREK